MGQAKRRKLAGTYPKQGQRPDQQRYEEEVAVTGLDIHDIAMVFEAASRAIEAEVCPQHEAKALAASRVTVQLKPGERVQVVKD
jgi:hypothetical protein